MSRISALLLMELLCVISHPIDPAYYIATAKVTSSPHQVMESIPTDQRGVLVQMFNWRYSEIQKECAFLGTHGFKGVQISPPQESLVFPNNNPPNPWWEAYQPKTYNISSRYGDRHSLRSLTKECSRWGVDVYADAVLNHMGSGDLSQFNDVYPGGSYFHLPVCNINNYCNHTEVRFCQLTGLNDLATDTERVRAKEAKYLEDLMSLGVNGFRFDASKHMWPADLQSIVGRLPPNTRNEPVDLYQEVVEGAACEIQPSEYYGTSATARVTDFGYAFQVAAKVNQLSLSDAVVYNLGQTWGLLPDNKAAVFIDNHDTERSYAPLTYKSGWQYYIAVSFMLSWPFGFPIVLSGYEFEDVNVGPPSYANGQIANNDCLNSNGTLWTCTHRFRPIAAASLWRAVTNRGSGAISNIFNEGGAVVGFSRSGKGYILFNLNSYPIEVVVQTGLPAGYYCDTATGDLAPSGCTGSAVNVGDGGVATIAVAAQYLSVIHLRSRTDDSCFSSDSCNKCEIESYRQDCGYFGITEEQCASNGCCWAESPIPNVPWCFFKNERQSHDDEF